jgi:F-box and leucine-rich repeat protein GRR1
VAAVLTDKIREKLEIFREWRTDLRENMVYHTESLLVGRAHFRDKCHSRSLLSSVIFASLTTSMGQRTPSPGRWGHSGGSEDDDDYDHIDYDYEPDVNVQPAKQWTAPGSIVVASPTHSATGRLNGSQGDKRLGIANFIPHEILVHIFKKLTTKGDQHSALLVSRAWCQCAVELLWHKLAVGNLASLLQMMHIISRKDQTFNYATFIRRLNFSVHASGMTDEIFIRLAPCIRLERLTLGNCASLTDTSLVAVFASCSSLIAVDLNGVPEVTDDAIITLANTTTKLQGINLTKCARITDAGILALAGHAPMLRRIKLSGLVLLTDVSVAAIANNCPLLLEIDLSNCSGLTDASIRDIWVHQRHLRELQLSVITSLTDDAFPSPPPPPPSRTGGGSAPTRLPTALPPQILRSPERRPPLLLPSLFDHLRILDMTSCAHLTDEGVEGIISNSPKIRQIVLTRCSSLTDEALMSISKLAKNLHFIHLGHVSQYVVGLNICDQSLTSAFHPLLNIIHHQHYRPRRHTPCSGLSKNTLHRLSQLH